MRRRDEGRIGISRERRRKRERGREQESVKGRDSGRDCGRERGRTTMLAAPTKGGPVQGRDNGRARVLRSRAREKPCEREERETRDRWANSSGCREASGTALQSVGPCYRSTAKMGVESRSPPPASRRLRLAGRSLPGQRQLLAQAHCERESFSSI